MTEPKYRLVYLYRGERYSTLVDYNNLADANLARREFLAAGWVAWIERVA